MFKLQGTQLKMSSAYHPETDGQTEVVNRCLETFLRCSIADRPRTWLQWLHWAEYWYNTSYHETTGVTPFEVVYGRKPPVLTRYVQGETRVEAVHRDLLDRDEALRQLKHHLQRAQGRMKSKADSKRKERSFSIGEWVFLKLRPHKQNSVALRINAKLSARYYGPYQVLERVGAVAYRLKLPSNSKVHPVFHVSLLKKAAGDYRVEEQLPLGMEGDFSGVIEPDAVLATRTINKRGENITQLLIQYLKRKLLGRMNSPS